MQSNSDRVIMFNKTNFSNNNKAIKDIYRLVFNNIFFTSIFTFFSNGLPLFYVINKKPHEFGTDTQK